MTNRIMELADNFAIVSYVSSNPDGEAASYARAALTTEVQAQQDYTRAVIAERDALDNRVFELTNEVAECSLEAAQLRKAAQMALEALYKALHTNAPFGWDATKALAALRKELGL